MDAGASSETAFKGNRKHKQFQKPETCIQSAANNKVSTPNFVEQVT